jgi:hypothetical protein
MRLKVKFSIFDERIIMNTKVRVDVASNLINVLQKLSYADKYEIYKFLKKQLFKDKMENLWASVQSNDLSMEDITELVEEVRQERYIGGKQNI